jgi:hypothetical protein
MEIRGARGRVVDIVARLRGWTIRGSNPSKVRALSLLQNVQTSSGATQSPIQWVSGLFPWVMTAGA